MELINCRDIREQMLIEAKVELTKIYAHEGKVLRLVVIQVEGDSASNVYIKNKIKTCEEVGINCDHIQLPSDIRLDILKSTIKYHINRKDVNAVMLQLPLPCHLKPHQQELLDLIPWQMDVDGLSTESIGRLWSGQECLVPCTAQGIMRLLPEDLSGKSVSIINRSNLIGKPLIKLLLDRNATPTIFHSKSGGYGDIVNEVIWSDYVITGTGQAKWIKCYENEWSDVTIIDAAICRDEENKLCGDVNIKTFEHTNCKITPVPGSVGILTTAQLILNVVAAYKLQQGE